MLTKSKTPKKLDYEDRIVDLENGTFRPQVLGCTEEAGLIEL